MFVCSTHRVRQPIRNSIFNISEHLIILICMNCPIAFMVASCHPMFSKRNMNMQNYKYSRMYHVSLIFTSHYLKNPKSFASQYWITDKNWCKWCTHWVIFQTSKLRLFFLGQNYIVYNFFSVYKYVKPYQLFVNFATWA